MTAHELMEKRARDILPEAVHFLREIVAIPSMSGKEEAVARRVAREMMQRGFDEVSIDDFGSVIGRIGEGPRTLLYDAHIDTVGVGDPKAWPHDPYQIRSATVVGDVLLLTLSYGGGCERHDFQLVVSTRFLETFPVRARAFVTHEDHDDPCDALVTRKLGFDLEPLEQAFKDAYPSDPGPLLIELEGWEEALRFEMD